jgi:MFS family permease
MGSRFLTRNIVVLSLVSLCTDVASEMLYPIMPIFLQSIGFSVLLIGVLEGVAEATAGLSKGFFGQWSDRIGRRAPFIRIGYGLSAVSKPMMALSALTGWIFLARLCDRLGKGVRTASRDALLSDEATPETKGRVFGFHRGADTLGAALGPIAALIFLSARPGAYPTLFLLAFIPGALAVALGFMIRERGSRPVSGRRPSFAEFTRYWPKAPAAYRKLTAGLLVFSLFNSSDVFLLLAMKQAGLGDGIVIGAYIFYNFVYAALSYPLGALGDRVGLKGVCAAGLLVFAGVYGGMAANTATTGFFALFFFYGVYAAATEGVSKAWITNLVPKAETATAIGAYTAFQSVCALVASTAAGLLWMRFGLTAAFLVTGAAAAAAATWILVAVPRGLPR